MTFDNERVIIKEKISLTDNIFNEKQFLDLDDKYKAKIIGGERDV